MHALAQTVDHYCPTNRHLAGLVVVLLAVCFVYGSIPVSILGQQDVVDCRL